MNPKIPLILFCLPLATTFAATKTAPPAPESVQGGDEQSPAAILAAQVEEIASATSMSRKSQAKLITDAVRLALTTATEGLKKPGDRLRVAAELATAAAKAAPHFAATITSAITSVPSIAGIEGALEKIQAAVSAGVEAGEDAGIANPVSNPPRPPSNPEFGGPNKGETVVSPSH